MIKRISYLKFLLKSTNQHGVHSPFVYNYLTKCLYKKPRLSKDTLEDVLLKSVPYFNCKRARIDDPDVKDKFSSLKFEPPFDMVVFATFHRSALLELLERDDLHNGTLIIIPNLRKQQVEWKKAIAHPKITVSIDCFTLGILFIRKEQVKEHFTIRL